MQWIKCCEERIEKFEALMDKPPRTDSLRKIRACSLQVLKVFVSDSCLYHYLKHSKCPQKFRKSMATYGVNVK